MKAGERQKQVLSLFGGDKELVIKKSDMIHKHGIRYYHNTQKHLGDVLTRLINNGMLKRTKIGYYKLGLGIKKVFKDPAQTDMFKSDEK